MANKDFKVKNGLDIQTPLPVTMGGTGQTSTTNTLNSLLPPQSGNTNKVLQTDGTNTSWGSVARLESNTFTSNQLISVNTSSNALEIRQIGAGNALLVEDETNPDSSPFIINASGNVGVGTLSPAGRLHAIGDIVQQSSLDNVAAFTLNLRKSRGTASAPTAVQGSDTISSILGSVYDGSSWFSPAWMDFKVNGSVTTNNVPVDIRFFTGVNGNPTERVRITSSGNFGIGTSSPSQKLDVNGGVNASSYTGPLSGGENIRSSSTTPNCPANTNVKIGQLNGLSDGLYAIYVSWISASNPSSGQIYWGTWFGGIAGIGSTGAYFNGSPSTALTMTATQHHRTAALPTFTLASDNSLGVYGNLSLYINFPQITDINGLSVLAKRLTT